MSTLFSIYENSFFSGPFFKLIDKRRFMTNIFFFRVLKLPDPLITVLACCASIVGKNSLIDQLIFLIE